MKFFEGTGLRKGGIKIRLRVGFFGFWIRCSYRRTGFDFRAVISFRSVRLGRLGCGEAFITLGVVVRF